MSASTPQRNLAQNLYSEREIPADVWARLQARMDNPGLMPRVLRDDFDAIIKANYPRRGRSAAAVATAESPWPDWSDTQQSSYALPEGVLPEASFRRLATRGGTGEFVFFELKEYRGRWYCKKLTGAPGAFTRSTICAEDQRALHAALSGEGQQERATRLFGLLYSCCGVCKAPLTDDLSRSLNMGPHCRKTRYGYRR